MRAWRLLLTLAAPCLVACAAAPARKPATAMPAAGMTSVPLPLGETQAGGEPLYRPLPAYPSAQLAACPASEEIDVVVHVDEAGRVRDVVGAVIDLALPPWDTFFAVVRPAVMRWRFAPLRVGHWAADAQGNPHAVDESKAQRFARRYRFDFTCHAGDTRVTAEAEGPAYPR